MRFCNAPVDLYALFVTEFKPAYDLFKCAMATTAHIVTQHGGAMSDTGTFCGNFFWDSGRVHAAIITLDMSPVPACSASAKRVRESLRTSQRKVADPRRNEVAPFCQIQRNVHRPSAECSALPQACPAACRAGVK